MAYDRTAETRVAANNKSEIYYRQGGRIVVGIAIIINNYCIHFVSFDIKLQFNSSLRVRRLMRAEWRGRRSLRVISKHTYVDILFAR